MPVDAAVGQPRLGGSDSAIGNLGGLAAGQFADGEIAPLFPGNVIRAAARLMRAGEIEKRRQHGAALDRSGGDELRNRQQFDLGRIGRQWGVGQYAVGRSQIDTDDVLSRHFFAGWLVGHVGWTSVRRVLLSG